MPKAVRCPISRGFEKGRVFPEELGIIVDVTSSPNLPGSLLQDLPRFVDRALKIKISERLSKFFDSYLSVRGGHR